MSERDSGFDLPAGVEVRAATDEEQRTALDAAVIERLRYRPAATLLYTVDFEPGRGWFCAVYEVEWDGDEELRRTRKFIARELAWDGEGFELLENYRRENKLV